MHYAEQYFNSAASDDEPEDGENNAPGHWKISGASRGKSTCQKCSMDPPGDRARPTGPSVPTGLRPPGDRVGTVAVQKAALSPLRALCRALGEVLAKTGVDDNPESHPSYGRLWPSQKERRK